MRPILAALVLALAAPSFAEQDTSSAVRLFQSGDWVRAKAEFSSDARRNDSDARAHFYLGRMALIDNDPDTAAEHL